MKEYKHIISKLRQAQEVCKDANRPKENKRIYVSMIYGYCLGVNYGLSYDLSYEHRLTFNQVDLACGYLLKLQNSI